MVTLLMSIPSLVSTQDNSSINPINSVIHSMWGVWWVLRAAVIFRTLAGQLVRYHSSSAFLGQLPHRIGEFKVHGDKTPLSLSLKSPEAGAYHNKARRGCKKVHCRFLFSIMVHARFGSIVTKSR